ncbi:MAG: hypothetical protein LC098_04180 [Burkholderiales bacterium]|nr:hypothetical protein [Burkholderiales bacterium]
MTSAFTTAIYPRYLLRIIDDSGGYNVTFSSRESGAIFGCNCEFLQLEDVTGSQDFTALILGDRSNPRKACILLTANEADSIARHFGINVQSIESDRNWPIRRT